jgi:hypothetical protein
VLDEDGLRALVSAQAIDGADNQAT